MQGTGELDDRTVEGIASDGTPDRAGDILDPLGCAVGEYRKNNIVLANHDSTRPIGTAEILVTPSAVLAKIRFAPKGVSQLADEWCGLSKAGILSALSVGFDPIAQEPRPGGGGWLYKAWTLLELSIVAVPCNSRALITQRGLKSSKPIHRKACGIILQAVESPASFAARKRAEVERAALAPYAALDNMPPNRAERLRTVANLKL